MRNEMSSSWPNVHLDLNICNAIINKSLSLEKFEITNVSTEKYSEHKLGYMADHLLLRLDVLSEGQKLQFQYFLKSFPSNTYDVMKEYTLQSNAFRKEIFFYNTLLGKLKAICATVEFNVTPTCYFTRDDDLLALEDLKSKGFKLCELEYFDDNHLRLALETVASLHARSIVYEEKTNCCLLSEFASEMVDGINRKGGDFTGYFYLRAAHLGLLRAADVLPLKTIKRHEFKKYLNTYFEQIFTLLCSHATFKNVFSHGDLWPANVLFKYENDAPTQCKLVDFQLTRYSPPANDVLYFLFSAMEPDERRTRSEYYLRFYYSALQKHLDSAGLRLEGILSFGEFAATCNLLFPPLMLKHAYQVMLMKANAPYMAGVYANAAVYSETLFEDRSGMVEYLLRNDSEYEEVVLKLLEELEDLIGSQMKGRPLFFQDLR